MDGRLLTARAPEQWADAADELLRDPARRGDMGRAARLRARSFDRRSHAEAVMAAYREVLEPRPVGIRATAP